MSTSVASVSVSVQFTILTQVERTGWVNPFLAGFIAFAMQAKDMDIEYLPAFDFKTSQEARNWACERFLDSKHDYLLMVDNDTKPWVSGGFVDLLDLVRLARDNEKHIVAAPVATISKGYWMLNMYMRHGDLYRNTSVKELEQARDMDGELLERDAMGSGAICLSREVVEKIQYQPGRFYTMMDIDIITHTVPAWLRPRRLDGNTKLGEDMYFGERAKQLGYFSYAAVGHVCGHMHTIDYLEIPDLKYAVGEPEEKKPESDEEEREEVKIIGPWMEVTEIDEKRGKVTKKRVSVAKAYGLPEQLNGELPAVTEWSITPEIAEFLRKMIREKKPGYMLELGSGISTFVIDDVLEETVKMPWFISIEHNEKYLIKCESEMLYSQHAPLKAMDSNTVWYDLQLVKAHWVYNFIDMVFVDGPPGNLCKYARYPALPKLLPYLANHATLVMDDCHRQEEVEIMNRWQQEFKEVKNMWFEGVGSRIVGVVEIEK